MVLKKLSNQRLMSISNLGTHIEDDECEDYFEDGDGDDEDEIHVRIKPAVDVEPHPWTSESFHKL